MTKHLALLRGINVGGKCKVAMSELKTAFSRCGFTEVQTYINSGNVIFVSETTNESKMVKTIETELEKTFGFFIPCVIVSATTFKKIAAAIPEQWQNNPEQKTDVLFLWEPYRNQSSLSILETKPDPTIEETIYSNGAIIWHVIRTNYYKSGMATFAKNKLYKHMTARNVNTVRKLASMV